MIVYSRETISDDNQNTPFLEKLWNVLELRILVAGSLFFQIVLICLGNRRKHMVNKRVKLWVWFTYLSADWIAILALGILSKDTKGNNKTETDLVIMAIWAPFLLVHLGGPDTITSYSLEDNELWYRRLFESTYQLAITVYVVYRSWNTSPLKYVTVPIVVAGMIKYGERTWSLWSGSRDGLRASILTPPNPGLNYANFMDDYNAKKSEGYHVTIDKFYPVVDHNSQGERETIIPNQNIPDCQALHDGFKFYNIPQFLFADLMFSFQDYTSSKYFFHKSECKDAFKAIEVELGLIYDKLYTKAVLTCSKLGIFLKSVSFLCTLSAFIAFTFLILKQNIYIELDNEGNKYRNYDLIITFVLFIGAILLEIYAVIVLLSSSSVMNWLTKQKNWRVDLLYKFIWFCQICFKLSHTIRWSNQMTQFNLIRFCLKVEPIKRIEIPILLRIYNFFEKYYYQKTKQVSEGLKELIFCQLKIKSEEAINFETNKILRRQKGDHILDKWNCHTHVINQSIKGVEFDESILLWHIATDLCYFSDDMQSHGLNLAALRSREESRLLSDYMLYLLVICPFLLPSGIGDIRFEDTCAEVDELLKERKFEKDSNRVCKMILRVDTEIPPLMVKGNRSKSVLFDACRLAKSLQSLETEEHWTKEMKWGMISHVWVERLCHAASQCRGLNHAKQLSQGGELITHVWLLMAHLGITEQFEISQDPARARVSRNVILTS